MRRLDDQEVKKESQDECESGAYNQLYIFLSFFQIKVHVECNVRDIVALGYTLFLGIIQSLGVQNSFSIFLFRKFNGKSSSLAVNFLFSIIIRRRT